MSAKPILHHYPASPFSEKVRIALGYKGMAYASVRIPAIMPKPDVVALTGGYRRTPILQLGSHVFCDTPLILRVLEELVPNPTLFAHPAGAAVAQWADHHLFDVAVGITSRPTKVDTVLELMTQEELAGFTADRKAMREGGTRRVPHFTTARLQLPIYLARIERMLASSAYLLGDQPGEADMAVYHCLWFVDMLGPDSLPEGGAVRAWMARMQDIGHGQPQALSSQAALELCRAADGSEWPTAEHAPIPDVALGTAVSVRADDWGRDTVEGELCASASDELVLRRTDPNAGTVYVHFPRLGFEVRAS